MKKLALALMLVVMVLPWATVFAGDGSSPSSVRWETPAYRDQWFWWRHFKNSDPDHTITYDVLHFVEGTPGSIPVLADDVPHGAPGLRDSVAWVIEGTGDVNEVRMVGHNHTTGQRDSCSQWYGINEFSANGCGCRRR